MLKDLKLIYLREGRTTPFSPTCQKIMDLFLEYPNIYFTPKTMSVTGSISYHSCKNMMTLLSQNSYLIKEDGCYKVTKESMLKWSDELKAHLYEGLE